MTKFLINKNQIIHSTGHAYLIKVPNETNQCFWFPETLTKKYGKRLIMNVPEYFEFEVMSGKKSVSKRTEYSEFIEEHFQPFEDINKLAQIVVHHVPNKIEPINRVVDDELIR